MIDALPEISLEELLVCETRSLCLLTEVLRNVNASHLSQHLAITHLISGSTPCRCARWHPMPNPVERSDRPVGLQWVDIEVTGHTSLLLVLLAAVAIFSK